MEIDKVRKISVDIPVAHYDILKEEAIKEEMHFGQLVRKIIKIFVEA